MFSSIQNFGGDFSQGLTQSDDGAAKPRHEDKQTCVPTTLRAIECSGSQGETEFKMFGSEVAFVVVVGVVEKLDQQGFNTQFTLNDGTSRMVIKNFSTDLQKPVRLTEGKYVEIVGAVRQAPEVHLSAQWIHPVECADQVSYHMIASAHASLKMQRGPAEVATPQKARPTAETGVSQGFAQEVPSPPKESRPAAPVFSAALLPESAPTKDLRGLVVEILQKANGEVGLSISEILAKCSNSDAASVRAVVDSLVCDGDAFNTIDDDHFALL